MASGRQSDISADTSRSLEAGRIVDRRLEAERGDRTDTRHGHEPSDLRIITCQLQNLAIEIVGLLLDGLTCLEQRPDHSDQLGTILDQFLGPHGRERGRSIPFSELPHVEKRILRGSLSNIDSRRVWNEQHRLNEAARAALKLVAARRLPRHVYGGSARSECMDRCSQKAVLMTKTISN